jgi:hypothetical protein
MAMTPAPCPAPTRAPRCYTAAGRKVRLSAITVGIVLCSGCRYHYEVYEHADGSSRPDATKLALTCTPVPAGPQRDADGDGVIDVFDDDDDNDGIPDLVDCFGPGAARNQNAGFELPSLGPNTASFSKISADQVPGWETNAPSNDIEIWQSGHNGVLSAGGEQHCEIQGSDFETVAFEVSTIPGSRLRYGFYHRGRDTTERMALWIGAPAATVSQGEFETPTGAWVLYEGTYEVPAGQTTTRFEFEAVAAADPGRGNLLDEAATEPICVVDTDGDGCVDSEDADADGDGIIDTPL